MSEFCSDCQLPIKPCGWGEDNCNNPDRPEGAENIEMARILLGQPDVLERDFNASPPFEE